MVISSIPGNWLLAETEPGQFENDAELESGNPKWIKAIVPGTVAQSLEASGHWSIDRPVDFDGSDWWYKGSVDIDVNTVKPQAVIRFEGLATLCEIWLNGEFLGASNNMFIPFEFPLRRLSDGQNSVYLCFRSLAKALTRKQPRPKWKTKLVSHQNLRYFRTTLLGRIPGWSPPVAPVGPWKPITLGLQARISNLSVSSRIENDRGIVEIEFCLNGYSISDLSACLKIGDDLFSIELNQKQNQVFASAMVQIDHIKLWWPHTHGTPCLYPGRLILDVNGETEETELTPIGFKSVSLNRDAGLFELKINGVAIFCRGACWTVNDITSLTGNLDQLRANLKLIRDAGANMMRIGGTMLYESEDFYRICDELGILIWQDFQFANMDYPMLDDEFASSVKQEISFQLKRLRSHPCIGFYCGGSEIEQQAAMMGISRDEREDSKLAALLEKLCDKYHPQVPFIASTPHGGSLPFHSRSGVTHYYGVGAYLQPVSHLRQHAVKFTAECLAIANIPVKQTRDQLFGGNAVVTHHPLWKSRTPRDSGAGWDFEDVRDHYFKSFFKLDPVQVRSFNPERYLELSAVLSGEIMTQVFDEWRSAYSDCAGGLVWFFKDLWAGAGWGIIDCHGIPKACYYFLKRSWQPVNIAITNENLNGLHFHLLNDNNQDISADFKLTLLTLDNVDIAKAVQPVTIPARSSITLDSDALLSEFYDITYSYRFGVLAHHAVTAELVDKNDSIICETVFFPDRPNLDPVSASSLAVKVCVLENNRFRLELSSSHLLYAVNIDSPGYLADDNFFHLPGNRLKRVTLEPIIASPGRLKGFISAINLDNEIRIQQPVSQQ